MHHKWTTQLRIVNVNCFKRWGTWQSPKSEASVSLTTGLLHVRGWDMVQSQKNRASNVRGVQNLFWYLGYFGVISAKWEEVKTNHISSFTVYGVNVLMHSNWQVWASKCVNEEPGLVLQSCNKEHIQTVVTDTKDLFYSVGSYTETLSALCCVRLVL